MMDSRFHLSLAVDSLDEATTFYASVLDQRIIRSTNSSTHFDFFGHHLVLHQHAGYTPSRFFTGGDDVPHPHYGVILSSADWKRVWSTLESRGVRPVVGPMTRYAKTAHEQYVVFISDPSGNLIELKCFCDDAGISIK
jgi:extradiol dioxygenase family protein